MQLKCYVTTLWKIDSFPPIFTKFVVVIHILIQIFERQESVFSATCMIDFQFLWLKKVTNFVYKCSDLHPYLFTYNN